LKSFTRIEGWVGCDMMEQNEVLQHLCDGVITIEEAAGRLGVSEEQVEELLDGFAWMPPPGRMRELCEAGRRTLALMRGEAKPEQSLWRTSPVPEANRSTPTLRDWAREAIELYQDLREKGEEIPTEEGLLKYALTIEAPA